MNNKRPFMVTFIGDISILGVVFLIATLFPSFLERFGIDFGRSPVYSLSIVRGIIAAVSLIAAVGFLKMKRWAYWLLIANSVIFVVFDVVLSIKSGQQPSYVNVLYSIVWLLFIIRTRQYFVGDSPTIQ